MLVRLRVTRGSHAGKEIRIPVPHFLIGRSKECHLRPASDLISRKHCALLIEETRVLLEDFGSKNGTYVNGKRVTGMTELGSGDILQVGPLQFEVLFEVQSESVDGSGPKHRSSPVEDDEIFAILQADNDGGSETRDMDSRIFRVQETQQIDPEELQTQTQSEDSSSSVIKKPEKPARIPEEKKKKIRQVGTDSREAAAETLRRFFNRR